MMEIKVVKDILSANDRVAAQNRQLFTEKDILVLNLMSSPGAGKTTFIMKTVEALKDTLRFGVIEGDVSSSIDTERLTKAGLEAIQINTGGGCHLDATMVNTALPHLSLDDIDVLFIENVGNLICPGGFDLGEHLKVVLLSTPEGDDKPYKYPGLFTIADAVVVTKTDLLPYVNFNTEDFQHAVKSVSHKAKLFSVSSLTGDGMNEWEAWLTRSLAEKRSRSAPADSK